MKCGEYPDIMTFLVTHRRQVGGQVEVTEHRRLEYSVFGRMSAYLSDGPEQQLGLAGFYFVLRQRHVSPVAALHHPDVYIDAFTHVALLQLQLFQHLLELRALVTVPQSQIHRLVASLKSLLTSIFVFTHHQEFIS